MPAWMRGVLLVAGFYNLAWGVFIYYFPAAFYSWLTETKGVADHLVEYQGAGVFLFGILYILSALYPLRFWYFVLVGLLSKLFGALAVYFFIVDQEVTQHFIFHLLVNDLLWVIPLAVITNRAIALRNMHKYEKAA